MTAPHFEHTTITCNNRQTLSARVFTPTSPIKGAVMIAPATGIKQQFYANFATYLQQHGFGVITFDNSGIGQSLNRSIKKSKASLQSWGEQDMPAVLEHLQR
ncbi:MAG: alpha/beta hydrolase, partial [Pseudoalteromonas sp.]|nr:alpha/beta hydrolase [Pseudoalteromonas sp.]